MRLGRNEPAAAGGSGTTEFTETFNRGDSGTVGNGWTEAQGATELSISGNAMLLSGGTSPQPVCVQAGTPMSGVNQFAKITWSLTDEANTFLGVIFRYTNSSSAHYGVYVGANAVEWYGATNDTTGLFAEEIQVANGATGWASGGNAGIVCKGTGDSTVVRVWINVTADAPNSDGTLWDGGAADYTFTEDPDAAVDTGTIMGITGNGSASDDDSTTDGVIFGTVT